MGSDLLERIDFQFVTGDYEYSVISSGVKNQPVTSFCL
jgi:hypothetical protein